MGIKKGNDWTEDPQGYARGFVSELTDKSNTLSELHTDLSNYRKKLEATGENTKLNEDALEVLDMMCNKLNDLKVTIDSKRNSMEA